ncbi:hypothetical protein [Bacillus sp. REN3]|uniref:hypothetical protein n=1 Tax=Bacillus sp. REN3 TaxID=2802440 RepID=UPI001AEDF97F|nr:hypothetical protein [Bacillus sp. REN3]
MHTKRRINIGLFILFLSGLLTTTYIILKGVERPWTGEFIIGFALFLLIYAFYQIVIILKSTRTMAKEELWKRVWKFTSLFAILSIVSLLVKPSSGLLDYGLSFGFALAWAFSDVIFRHEGH